jgi:hypothetical protein
MIKSKAGMYFDVPHDVLLLRRTLWETSKSIVTLSIIIETFRGTY